ncbi:MAG: anti-sigma factor antagonist [Clostridia bacterium]
MKEISGHYNNGILTIALQGSINSSNATAVEEEISKLDKSNASTTLIIDAENLEYISSAGLRIILRLGNSHDDLKIVNVSSSVYEVFEMTGFAEIFKVEKAYRKLSVDGCEVIGQGANGVVYRLDDDTIIKVYRNPDSLPEIKRERELARKAFVLGIQTAIPYDVVKVGNGYGSVFELLNAKSFAKLLAKEPEKLDYYVELYIDVLKKLHSTHVQPGDMPNMKDVALDWVDYLESHLEAKQYEKLKRMVSEVPERSTMIHGDYHIKNIMMQNDEVLLIDMDTLSYGHPIFELAQMYLSYVGFGEYDHNVTLNFMGLPYEITNQLWASSMREYFNTLDENAISEIVAKIKVVAYTRVVRRMLKREKDSVALPYYKEKLIKAIEDVDTLVFNC